MSSASRLVHRIVSGTWRENGYVIECGDAGAVIVDPGNNTAGFLALIAEHALRPAAIVNTHAHFDHIGSVVALVESFGIPFYLHKADAALLRQANLYRALFEEVQPIRVPAAFSDVSEMNGVLEILDLRIELLMTPGHTNGSTCLRIGDLLFTGDTLLKNGPGRIDLPGGSAEHMRASQALLATLPAELLVHPGHGEIESLGAIRDRVAAR
jgi:hydroxyacylglutathione hydrolase